MKRFVFFILICLIVFAASIPASGSEAAFDFGFSLPAPQDNSDRNYLGLIGKNRFTLWEIKSHIVLVEIFSMYCPICQREAKNVNQLFDLIQEKETLKNRIKVIGIGAGNSDFEAEFFRSNYSIRFPLFSDATYEIHKGIGEVGTPHFFGLKILENDRLDMVFSHSGEMESPEKFLEQLIEKSGLEFEQ